MAKEDIERVREEVLAALSTFTSEGFAEYVGFAVGGGEAHAELYGDEGEIIGAYRITFTIEEAS